ncbi:cobyrinic Acid a,c-diamide synthase [Roseibium sp. TrichSKD4]|uniref:cobyrinate a,c-diamide synthase n=1 Tax=Roseibium sp. TrichSKD4 TaxID=744980 RepID=UPI0001E563B0|nr:cobyrinate a,c-diamide synthase [Roseibium sp. TrichSKD4]EFO33042.1 cobyrinic Acid a,c-diamide synthase [Roseibium sp. TrichSKD4]
MTLGQAKGILIAAPSSGSGKTTLTLAVLRALRNAGHSVVSAKSGPDYIDPKFHEAASGAPCVNLDAWAMPELGLRALARGQAEGHDLFIIEAAMGLFDGAANGQGSAADLATSLGVPVLLVIDCAKQAQSVAALVNGFASFRSDVQVCGIVLNKVGSARHKAILRSALEPLGLPVLGAIPRAAELALPERHLGLVQAEEHEGLEGFLGNAAEVAEQHIDLGLLANLCQPLGQTSDDPKPLIKPFSQHIAVARDVAFAFCYPHMVSGWQAAGTEVSFFSPLADEAPSPSAQAIYLPGGYPELHAERLSAAANFKVGMSNAASSGKLIYGECGGFMTLGEILINKDGVGYEMLGLLPLETRFAHRKRHLGYRQLKALVEAPFTGSYAAHEFHYASTIREGKADRLFAASDAEGASLGKMGLKVGSVMGSFAHLICER